MGSSPGWLSRYESGQRAQVWQELRQLGGGIRDTPWAEEAQLVCDEMARRARRNIDLVVERLSADGYRFHANDDDQTPVVPHVPPTPGAAAQVDWLEQRFGMLPMTLSSWIRIVGDVWLVGTHPRWETSAGADPLVIEVEGSRYPGESPLRRYFDDEWTGWLERHEEDPGTAGLFVLPLAPDRLHKDNTSRSGALRDRPSRRLRRRALRLGDPHPVRLVPELGLRRGRVPLAVGRGQPVGRAVPPHQGPVAAVNMGFVADPG